MRRAWLIGLTALALMTSAAKCETTSDPRQPGHNPGNEAPHADPIVHLETWVPNKCSPYTITIDVKGGQGLIPEPTQHIAAGKWTHDIGYRSNANLLFSLGLTMSKAGCYDAYCLIDDGIAPNGTANQTKRTLSTGIPNTTCQLHTKR